MADFTYNSTIFTRLNKWDDNKSYTGILLADKINQKNGQDYKLVDVTDIDWDGMWVSFANTYVYDTEDLLDVLRFIDPTERFLIVNNRLNELQEILIPGDYIRISEDNVISTYNLPDFSYVADNYASYSYLYEYSYNRADTVQAINDKFAEIIGSADINFDSIQEISDWIVSQREYVPVDYEDIDFIGGQKYYIYEGDKYVEIDSEYVERHYNQQYYICRNVTDILPDIVERLAYAETTIGNVTSEEDGTYTYTGIMNDLHNLYVADGVINSTIGTMQTNISQISVTLSNVNILAQNAFDVGTEALNAANVAQASADAAQATADVALTYSEVALEKIGTDIIPAHFEQITSEEAPQYPGQTYIYTGNGYVAKNYDPALQETWYIYVPEVDATGMRKELNDLTYGLDRSLYGLHIDNTNAMSYVYLGITPKNFNGDRERTITMYSKNAEFSVEDKKIYEDGIRTATNVNTMISYVIEWADLK